MNRREFVAMGLAALCWPRQATAANRKIKTKSGSIVGNIVIEAKDADNTAAVTGGPHSACGTNG
jgi:hypothetical protein